MSNLESPLVRPQTPFPQQCPLLHTNPTKIPQRTPSAQTFSCLSVHCSVCAGCERSQGVGVLDWLPLAIPPTHPSSQLDCDITSCSFIWPARKLWESWSHLGHVWTNLTGVTSCAVPVSCIHCSAAFSQTLGVLRPSFLVILSHLNLLKDNSNKYLFFDENLINLATIFLQGLYQRILV